MFDLQSCDTNIEMYSELLVLITHDQGTKLAELLALQWLSHVVRPHLIGRHILDTNVPQFNLIGDKEVPAI